MQKKILFVLVVLCLVVVVYAQPTSGLVAYWSLNGNFTDAGPYNISVANTGVTATQNGINNQDRAMFFNNTLGIGFVIPATSFGTVTSNSNLNFSQSASYTITHWFKISNTGSIGSGFFDNNMNYNGYSTWVWGSSGAGTPLQVHFNAGGINVQSPLATTTINYNTWYHLAGVKDGATLRLYINGIQVATNTGTFRVSSYSEQPKIGSLWFNTSGYYNYGPFNGSLDELRIYNRALSPAEIGTLTVLPVRLTSLTAEKTGTAVVVNWKTAFEQNSSHFAVQRSYDGTNFETIGTITAKGNSSIETSYNYTDNAVNLSINNTSIFYRLQQYDVDGKNELSNTVAVKYTNTQPSIFAIRQNPVQGQLQLQCWLIATQQVTMQITDAQGRLMQQQKIQLNQGRSTTTLPVTQLASGLYHITVLTTAGKQTLSFIKK